MPEYASIVERLNAASSRLEAVLAAMDQQLWPYTFGNEKYHASANPKFLAHEEAEDSPQQGGTDCHPGVYVAIYSEGPRDEEDARTEAAQLGVNAAEKHWPAPLVVVAQKRIVDAQLPNWVSLAQARTRLLLAQYRSSQAQGRLWQEMAATRAVEKLLGVAPDAPRSDLAGGPALVSRLLASEIADAAPGAEVQILAANPGYAGDAGAEDVAWLEHLPDNAHWQAAFDPQSRFDDIERGMVRSIRERFQEGGSVSREIAGELGDIEPVAEANLFVLEKEQFERAAKVTAEKLQAAAREFHEHMALFEEGARATLDAHAVSLDIATPADQVSAGIATVVESMAARLLETRGKRFAHQRRHLVQFKALLPAAMRYPTQFILPLSLLLGALSLGAPASNAGIRTEFLRYAGLLFPLLYCAAFAIAMRDAKAERMAFAETARANLMAEIDRAGVTVGAVLEDQYVGSLRQAAKDLRARLQEKARNEQDAERQRQEEARQRADRRRGLEQAALRDQQKNAEATKRLADEQEAKRRREAEIRRRQLLEAESRRYSALEKLEKDCADALAAAKQVMQRVQKELTPDLSPAVLANLGN